MQTGLPPRQGLYDPMNEHDACGLNFVCDMSGTASHRIVELGIGALCALDHRGAAGADPTVGDGSGILVQIPDAFLRAVVDFDLPQKGAYATGIAFLPPEPAAAAPAMAEIQRIASRARRVPARRPEALRTVRPDTHRGFELLFRTSGIMRQTAERVEADDRLDGRAG